MNLIYLVTPFVTWLVAGSLKFMINSIRARQLAFGLIGYGGLPSNHSAIVSSIATLIALKEGIDHPAFGVAITLAFIVILDANSLRQQVGKHAKALNQITNSQEKQTSKLRERIGHTRIEIIAGVITGILVSLCISSATNLQAIG
ncbi:divergent PAP2 family protein [uncultured Microbulbifer sp.]|uniref:divergent PAP2 family protein n=1 Tax=uncultured Microbulbifer sp. TaxID=348147 RepID=UPI002608DA5C|nr:divergent PAP2 family protein [uncultured Microbulbifer sp.]